MLSTITWPQVAIFAVLFAATIAAYKLLGEGAGAALGAVTALVSFFMGRPGAST